MGRDALSIRGCLEDGGTRPKALPPPPALPRGRLIWRALEGSASWPGRPGMRNGWAPWVPGAPRPRLIHEESGWLVPHTTC